MRDDDNVMQWQGNVDMDESQRACATTKKSCKIDKFYVFFVYLVCVNFYLTPWQYIIALTLRSTDTKMAQYVFIANK